VDGDDLDVWLAVAASFNGFGSPYRYGDANLDGTVDGQDFIEWNIHKFTNVAAWCSGDFNADGTVDGQDFILWNSNKFMSSDKLVGPETTASVAENLAGSRPIRTKRPTSEPMANSPDDAAETPQVQPDVAAIVSRPQRDAYFAVRGVVSVGLPDHPEEMRGRNAELVDLLFARHGWI
jgi:hypothetical protein